jgi:septal ring-binding cell division protein DamX
MKLDPNFVRDRKIKVDLDGGKLARGARSRRGHNVLVAVGLLVLLVVAILTHAAISIEVGDSSLDRQSYVALAIDVVLTLGLSWLLFSSRPRADNEGARS